ncbi:MAG: hypothetical protein KF884_11245 [Fimbriimonadaceae bacterium]|nr:hypothetical protein [Fimbriimonadaceae bacterium]QYK58119.1 MAG: hypothetical protein KF884_11245 [Fimbriimonadaceae bacterium]
MISPWRQRRFPYLSGYLRKLSEDALREPRGPGAVIALLGALGGGPLAFMVVRPLGIFVALLAGLFAAGAALALAWMADNQYAARTPPDRARRQAVYKIGGQFRSLETQRKLHKWMDPMILQLLEAASYHWTRLQTVLNGPAWSARDLPDHWKGIRQSAMAAADDGMRELVLMAQPCVGPPQRDRSEDLKGVVESFVDLEIADALQGLKSMSQANWAAYSHQSPRASEVFNPMRVVAEKIKDLADEIDDLSLELAHQSDDRALAPAGRSIDVVLSELRAIKQAEIELEQEQLRQGP